jgi:hypothetical protein
MSDLVDEVKKETVATIQDKALEYVKKVPWWGWALGITGAYLLFRAPPNESTEK